MDNPRLDNPNAAGGTTDDPLNGPKAATGSDRSDFDQLIQKAQELVRNLDSISGGGSSSNSIDPASLAQLDTEPKSIGELDQALAANLDTALQSQAEAVESVLDSVFQEQAAVVQNIDQPPVVETPEPPGAPAPQSEMQSTATAPAPPISTSNEIEKTTDLEASVEVISVDEPNETNSTPEMSAAMSDNSSPPVQTSPRAEAAPPIRSADEQRPTALKRLSAALAKPIVAALVIANYPLRFLPRSFRPAIDWIALSLLVWVPIVWIMVFAFGGEGSAKASSPAIERSPQAVHESSTNTAEIKQEHDKSHDADRTHGKSSHD